MLSEVEFYQNSRSFVSWDLKSEVGQLGYRRLDLGSLSLRHHEHAHLLWCAGTSAATTVLSNDTLSTGSVGEVQVRGGLNIIKAILPSKIKAVLYTPPTQPVDSMIAHSFRRQFLALQVLSRAFSIACESHDGNREEKRNVFCTLAFKTIQWRHINAGA